ncbi:hypothetical protein C2I18_03010 [Paenibacillus sp. PK3_47]|uniref:PT domain-containing protein n=1 Tax=Paenibacillus sp. PK3_47 TaxID=2072642 RepID=UPI00201E2032|nr:PT domain-containing protein [Paenibacillus sp. PK3_47]UQZ32616.1 hypothetical protein C2I18_03010 [Paenibacillus sp. PK3_47]
MQKRPFCFNILRLSFALLLLAGCGMENGEKGDTTHSTDSITQLTAQSTAQSTVHPTAHPTAQSTAHFTAQPIAHPTAQSTADLTAQPITDSTAQLTTQPSPSSAETAVGMPLEMPEDFAFSVRFGVKGKNEVNTFEHTVTKDLVSNGTATANLTLTQDELTEIYARMRDINVLGDLQLEIGEKDVNKHRSKRSTGSSGPRGNSTSWSGRNRIARLLAMR